MSVPGPGELLYAIYMGEIPIDMATSISSATQIQRERSIPHLGKVAKIATYKFQGWVPPVQLDLPFEVEEATDLRSTPCTHGEVCDSEWRK